MRVERERIPVKGQAPADVTLKFTRHGPVIHEDAGRHRAYALRWVGTEPGTAGYLGALSIHQADSWEAFRRGIEQWKVPSLNLVYADVDGNIGYHGVGLTPVRREGNGLLPVPGRTRDHDWVSYLPISELPRRFNPPEHFVATANHNVIPPGYPHLLGNELAPSFRYERIVEVLGEARRFSIADFEKLQHDAVSLPARRLVSLLAGVESDDPGVREALRLLAGWDGRVGRDLAAAAIYEVWFPVLSAAVYRQHVPDTAWSLLQGRFSTDRVLEWLRADAGRGRILLATLRQALDKLATRLGPDMKTWRWGTLHVAEFDHALGTTGPLRALFHLPSVPRDGDGETVGNTGSGSADQLQQRTGASYRHILDLADWDRSVGTNVPGQSGQPRSPHYGDLVPYWAEQRYFPLLFSRAAIEKHARHRLRLVPRG
jgi:penicillin amidase